MTATDYRLFADWIYCECGDIEFINECETFSMFDTETSTKLEVTISCEVVEHAGNWRGDEWLEYIPCHCDAIKVLEGEINPDILKREINQIFN